MSFRLSPRHRLRPGNRLLRAAGLLALVSLLAFVRAEVLWLVPVALATLAVLAWRDGQRAMDLVDQLTVSRGLPKAVGRDLEFPAQIVLHNPGAAEVAGEFRDVLPADCVPAWAERPFRIAGGASEAFVTECRIPRRGKQRFGPLWVRVQGPLGLLEAQREFELPGETKILPETFASREELQKDLGAELLMLDKIARARQTGAGTEFVSLDNYRRGDDPRRIDWRATARHGFPIVRRFQVERHRDVLILIDSGRLMGAMTDRGTKLDCAVDAALNLARVALRSGDRCGIGTFDSTLRGYLAPLAGPKSLGSLVDCVYDLQSQWQETDFTRMFAEIQRRHSKRSLLVVLSDLGDAETSRAHLAALSRLNKRHLVLFAALRTPLLNRTVHHETSSIDDGARQAVALGLLRDRGHALHALRHGGVHVLDVEPRQLTLPLINTFIELRQRNQL